MMELLNHVMKGDAIGEAPQVGRRAEKRHPSVSHSAGRRNVKSIVQLYERRSCSKSIQEEGKQDTESAMEVRRTPRLNDFQQHVTESRERGVLVVELPVESPKHGALVDAKSPAPPAPEDSSSDSSTKDIRRGSKGVKRKSSSVQLQKVMLQAVDNASHTIADSIDRIHAANSQIAEDRVKAQEVLFHAELDYLKKRDRRMFCIQKNLIRAINGLTEIITTGMKNSGRAGDAGKEIVSEGDVD